MIKRVFAISSEIPSLFFPGQCQSTGNPWKKHCNLWTAKKTKITASEPWEFDKMDSSMQKFGSKIITPDMCLVVLKFHYEKWQEGAIDFKASLVLVIFRKFIWSKAHFAQSKTFEAFCPKAEISFSEK